ncbi:outer membrane beta-barrel protein [Erythrobacter aquimaris]|uniref:Outer membrane beta-barrel protein n=1 Tax=Qipengyuania aquimaris TaxID=255984 RepID=A0A6I4TKQ6_9SPHN|nr:outer membrane beta-barrel protein [Qipengyuania aquimaris]MXO95103.1 outer membrane beta-barrel protein [Qipengyuania aquimaris]
MKKVLLTTAAAAGLIAIPSAAAAQGSYVSVTGGYVLPSDSDNSGETTANIAATDDFGAIPSGTSVGWNTEFDNGFEASGAFGYATESGLRFEGQLFYNSYDVETHSGLTVGGGNIDAVDVAVLTRGPADDANPTVGAVIADGQGDVSNVGLFGNVYYDIGGPDATFKPFVGAGLGYQWTDVNYQPSGVDVADDSDGSFGYQLMAGAGFEVSEGLDIFAQYTYRDSFNDPEVELNLLPATLEVETQQSIVSLGVRFNFGG